MGDFNNNSDTLERNKEIGVEAKEKDEYEKSAYNMTCRIHDMEEVGDLSAFLFVQAAELDKQPELEAVPEGKFDVSEDLPLEVISPKPAVLHGKEIDINRTTRSYDGPSRCGTGSSKFRGPRYGKTE